MYGSISVSYTHLQGPEDLPAAVDWVLQVPGVLGALAVQGQQMAAGGAVELTALAAKGDMK